MPPVLPKFLLSMSNGTGHFFREPYKCCALSANPTSAGASETEGDHAAHEVTTPMLPWHDASVNAAHGKQASPTLPPPPPPPHPTSPVSCEPGPPASAMDDDDEEEEDEDNDEAAEAGSALPPSAPMASCRLSQAAEGSGERAALQKRRAS